jgi:hypothetical protein
VCGKLALQQQEVCRWAQDMLLCSTAHKLKLKHTQRVAELMLAAPSRCLVLAAAVQDLLGAVLLQAAAAVAAARHVATAGGATNTNCKQGTRSQHRAQQVLLAPASSNCYSLGR